MQDDLICDEQPISTVFFCLGTKIFYYNNWITVKITWILSVDKFDTPGTPLSHVW